MYDVFNTVTPDCFQYLQNQHTNVHDLETKCVLKISSSDIKFMLGDVCATH